MSLLWLLVQLVFWCAVIGAILAIAAAVILVPPAALGWYGARYLKNRRARSKVHIL